jgi:hypothetical protein
MLPNKAGLQIVQHREQKHVLSLKKNGDSSLFISELANFRIESSGAMDRCESIVVYFERNRRAFKKSR